MLLVILTLYFGPLPFSPLHIRLVTTFIADLNTYLPIFLPISDYVTFWSPGTENAIFLTFMADLPLNLDFLIPDMQAMRYKIVEDLPFIQSLYWQGYLVLTGIAATLIYLYRRHGTLSWAIINNYFITIATFILNTLDRLFEAAIREINPFKPVASLVPFEALVVKFSFYANAVTAISIALTLMFSIPALAVGHLIGCIYLIAYHFIVEKGLLRKRRPLFDLDRFSSALLFLRTSSLIGAAINGHPYPIIVRVLCETILCFTTQFILRDEWKAFIAEYNLHRSDFEKLGKIRAFQLDKTILFALLYYGFWESGHNAAIVLAWLAATGLILGHLPSEALQSTPEVFYLLPTSYVVFTSFILILWTPLIDLAFMWFVSCFGSALKQPTALTYIREIFNPAAIKPILGNPGSQPAARLATQVGAAAFTITATVGAIKSIEEYLRIKEIKTLAEENRQTVAHNRSLFGSEYTAQMGADQSLHRPQPTDSSSKALIGLQRSSSASMGKKS